MAIAPQDPHKAVITSVGYAIGGGTVTSTKPVITGTADAGTTVDIFDGVRMIGTAIVDSKGNWLFTPTADLKVGAHSFTAISVDRNGDFGASSTPMSVTVPADTPVAPVKPIINELTDDSGNPILPTTPTNDAHPTMSGTGTPGDTITMYDGTMPIGSTIIDGTGHWVLKPTTDLDSGSHDVFVVETSPAGVPSVPSDHYPVVIDTSVPATPSITTMTNDSGAAIPAGSTTADAHPHISGTGTAGDTIMVYDGGTIIGSTTIDGDGKWSFTPSSDLTGGSHSITVVDVNAAGTPSAHSNPISVVILGVPDAPAAPTITDDNGANIPAGSTTNVSTPHISGTGHWGDAIVVYDGATVLGTATVDKDGKWTFTPSPPLSNGSHSISVTVVDGAGESAHSEAISITTSKPTVTITGLYDHYHNLIAQNGSTTGSVTIEGTASGYADGDQVCLAFSGPATAMSYNRCEILVPIVGGKFSVTVFQDTKADAMFGSPPLFLGTGSFTVMGLLLHPDFSVYASGPGYTITDTNWTETGLPATPTLSDDTGANIPAGGTTSISTPHISGMGRAGDTITVFDGATTLGSATVGVDGKWTFTPSPPLSGGSHSISVTESNGAGASAHSASISVTTSVPTVSITGLYDHNHKLIAQNGSTNGPVTIEGTARGYADGDQVGLTFTGPATAEFYSRCEILVTVEGGKFSVTVSQDTKGGPTFGGNPLFERPGSFTVSALLMHSTDPGTATVYAKSDGYTITDTNWTVAGVQTVRTQTDNSDDHSQAASAGDSSQPELQTNQHTVVGEHDTFVGKAVNGNEIVDLNADPMSYFKETTAHIEGAKHGAIDTLHLTGDHQVLDLTSLTGQTAAAKISGIEVVDLGGQHNTLKLSLIDVLNLGETDLFQKDGKQQMMVQGKDGDTVDLSNTHIAGLADGEWAAHGTTQVGGVTYNVYEHSGAHTELLVQQGVQIVVH